ncbi:Tfx family DNA-binding protein [Thermogladius sp. 4427co]|uniref:Tfx family DNA-binding protein n=1 Tax=Thermogladius sp. 4427co TaxID=3450718 RepID=UPI003F797A64
MDSTSKYGFLTEKQYKVLKLRMKGLTQAEVAYALGMSRAAVALAEKRAWEKIRKAEETLKVFREIAAAKIVLIDEGVKLVDIPGIILNEADKLGIKIRANFDYIFGMIRFKANAGYPRLKKKIRVYLMRDGTIDIEGVE